MLRKRGLNWRRSMNWLGLVLMVAGVAVLITVLPGWFWFFILGVGLIVGGLAVYSR